MKTKTYTVYSFSELSPAAKERAKQEFAADNGFSWSDDYLESLKALAAHFGGKLSNCSIDWFNGSYSSADFDMPDNSGEEGETIAARLAELGAFDVVTLKGTGECKLTGFCGDESAIDGFRAAFHAGERDLEKLMQAAFQEWLKDAQADCESQFEDETFEETCEANNYQFTADGKID